MLKKIIAVFLLASVLASALAVVSSAAWHYSEQPFKVLNCLTFSPIYAGLNASPNTNIQHNDDNVAGFEYDTTGLNGWTGAKVRIQFSYNSTLNTYLWYADFLLDFDYPEADSFRAYLTFDTCRVYNSSNGYKSALYNKDKCYWEPFYSRDRTAFGSGYSSTAPIVIETDAGKVHIHLEGSASDHYTWGDYYKYLFIYFYANSFNVKKDGSTVAEYEKKESENAASDVEEQSEQAQSQVTGAIDNTISSLNTLGSAMSTTSTSVNSWTLPAMYIPATSVTPRIELSGEKQIDFASWIDAIPPNILTLIQLVCSIALFMYCGKEIIDIISVLLNNRKGIEGLDNDLSKKG